MYGPFTHDGTWHGRREGGYYFKSNETGSGRRKINEMFKFYWFSMYRWVQVRCTYVIYCSEF